MTFHRNYPREYDVRLELSRQSLDFLLSEMTSLFQSENVLHSVNFSNLDSVFCDMLNDIAHTERMKYEEKYDALFKKYEHVFKGVNAAKERHKLQGKGVDPESDSLLLSAYAKSDSPIVHNPVSDIYEELQ